MYATDSPKSWVQTFTLLNQNGNYAYFDALVDANEDTVRAAIIEACS